MAKLNKFKSFLLPASCAVSLLSASIMNTRFELPDLEISKQESSLNLSSELLAIGSLGNKRLFSALLWIATLLEADTDHYKKSASQNWMYLRFHTISKLDPRFYENYLWGGMLLSIVKDDPESAAELFESGLNLFPNDYRLNYIAGFNDYFELGDYASGLLKFQRIQDNPQAPMGLKFIVGKLRYETTGDYETTRDFLEFNLQATPNEMLQKKLRADLYALTADRDLECLNTLGPSKCSINDYEGNKYVLKNGSWVAPKEYISYKINRKKKGEP